MATSALLSINPYTHPATAHEDLFNGNLTTDIISLANYGSAVFVLTKGPGGDRLGDHHGRIVRRHLSDHLNRSRVQLRGLHEW